LLSPNDKKIPTDHIRQTAELVTLLKNLLMIVTCVHVTVKPESVDDFIKATIPNHKGTVNEEGNLRFDVLQNADDPCRFMIYEAFKSEEAVAFHKTTEHYLAWRDTVKDMMAETRYGVRYGVIEPRERSAW